MPNHVPFRLNRNGLLLALVSAAFAGEAGAAAAGRVDFAAGGATVSGPTGEQRPLTKGAELDKGDTVRTNQDGRAQIRFSDGAYVSLQPNTEFAIKDYNFEGKTDGSERGLFGLAKGAMRTVTGLIGRVNKNRYAITTPTATIGIRGTGGRIEVLNDGSTLINGTSGIWTLTNPVGTIDVPAGVSGRAPSAPNQPPTQTSDAPSAGPAQPAPPPVFVAGEQRTASGAPLVATFTPLVSGSGYAASTAFFSNGIPFQPRSSSATATFNAGGQLTALTSGPDVYKLDPTAGAHADFGSDGILAWGRWNGAVSLTCSGCVPENYGPNQGLHYVVGMPTATLPASGAATYSLLGATKPTYSDGSAAGTFSGSLSVTFGGIALVTGNFNVAMGDGRTFTYTGTGCTSASVFSMFGTVTSSAGCGACGCTSSVGGFFAGSSAERAGIAYHFQDATKNVLGAAAFQKQ